jgi:hypothetical protein
VLEAMPLLGAAAAAQKWVPMTKWSGILGRHEPVPAAWLGQRIEVLPSRSATVRERQVADAIRSGCRWLPWEPTCLAQATAGQVLLKQFGQPGVVVIGLKPNPDSPSGTWDAHAWLLGRNGALTGGPAARGFTATTVYQVPGALTADQVNVSRPQPS